MIIARLLNRGLERANSEIEIEYIRLLNKYIISVSVVLLTITIYDSLNVAYHYFSPFVLLTFIFFITFYTHLRFNKLVQIIICIISGLIFFFYSSYTGFESGISLYYIPLVLSLPFMFNIREDRDEILVILFFVFIELGINYQTDYRLFWTNSYTREVQKEILRSSLIGSGSLIFLIVYFIFYKISILTKHYRKIRTATIELNKIKTDLLLNTNEIKKLIALAEERNPSFFVKFKAYYPDFFQKLTALSPNILMSELEFCAYLKLNFTTKEIAIFTNSTVRSVQAKKYRIRKKFNIPKEADLNLWMMDL